MNKPAAKHASVGNCEECHKLFEYVLVHNGVQNSSYTYCGGCGKTAILDISDARFPVELVKQSAYRAIAPGIEQHLNLCECGGKFMAGTWPRCPHCREPLSPIKAAAYIERHAPSKAANWRWQGNWTGNYCIVIEGSEVRNNFK